MNKNITAQDIEYLRRTNTGSYYELLKQLGNQAMDFFFDYCNDPIRKVRVITHNTREVAIYFTAKRHASAFCREVKTEFDIQPQAREGERVTLDISDTLKVMNKKMVRA